VTRPWFPSLLDVDTGAGKRPGGPRQPTSAVATALRAALRAAEPETLTVLFADLDPLARLRVDSWLVVRLGDGDE
jgi:hypothetical protein